MATTKDMCQAVRAELDFDPLVDQANITVKNMNGDVALNGQCRATRSTPRRLRRRGGSRA